MSATAKTKKPKGESRRREPALKVYCTPSERKKIEDLARQAGLKVSAFLRRVGTGSVPCSAENLAAVKTLVKMHADQGRLGGLLKALLTNDERLDGYNGKQIQMLTEGLLKDIEETQTRIRAVIEELERPREMI